MKQYPVCLFSIRLFLTGFATVGPTGRSYRSVASAANAGSAMLSAYLEAEHTLVFHTSCYIWNSLPLAV